MASVAELTGTLVTTMPSPKLEARRSVPMRVLAGDIHADGAALLGGIRA